MYYEALQGTVRTIELSDEIVQKYAKKIFGFAYSKTRNTLQAEDLAQDILCSLTDSLRRQESIADLDGFVYTVSCYTWSKFLRGNKKHWNNLDVDVLFDLKSEHNVEADALNMLMIERLKNEIAYLTELHRKITLLFYYENKTGGEIAELLNISHSTVRWHLSEIKKKLKAGIEMDENLSYQPKRLMCGHDGWVRDTNMHGIGCNPLVDNICIACYGKPLTIEELSRTLHVAAAYIEPLVKDLLYMDYLCVKDKNRYQTNFCIRTENFMLAQTKYKLHNIKTYAEKIIGVYRAYQDEIKSIGFVGSDLETDFLLWAFIPAGLQNLYYQSLVYVLQKNKVVIDTPKHKDGTRHWVCAWFCDDKADEGRFTEEEILFKQKAYGNGIKTRDYGDAGTGVCSIQYDSYATINIGINWREFGSNEDLNRIKRIAAIIRNNEKPNDYDKQMIVSFIEQGYVKIENNRPKLLIPFLFPDEWQKYNALWQKINHDIGENIFAEFIEGFTRELESEIPPFISNAERIYLKYQAYPQYSVLYWLSDNGLLRYPTDEEAKRLCTIVWCK